MNMNVQAPKGTKDILPGESYKWDDIENMIREVCGAFNYKRIRTPVFEHTEVFQRGVGDTTDIVQKEMYTFEDKGGRSITLRPEGTAGVVRSFIEHGMNSLPMPVKLYYFVTCYRYEKAQKGRYREHNQFGIELFGVSSPEADVEVIALAAALFEKLGIMDDLKLNINSIGCPVCRKEFMAKFIAFVKEKERKLCGTCMSRLTKNPLRILDCKEEMCQDAIKGCPVMIDFLCGDCAAHFEKVKTGLTDLGLEYVIDTGIVRGQDYYTNTVFEFVYDKWETQNTVCGGGRYNGLVEICGGKPTPGIGFGLGLERLIMCVEDCHNAFAPEQKTALYIGNIGEEALRYAGKLVYALRKRGIAAESDLSGRGLKAQMKYAGKLGCRYSLVLGDDEIATGQGQLKDMQTGEVRQVALERLCEELL